MYAYIMTGGKQYRVAAGEKIKVEMLGAEPGSTVKLDKVMVVVKDGGNTMVGKPYIQNASVSAEVLSTDKQDKILVFHQLTRKNMRKLRGHRQSLTTLRITGIEGV